MINLKIFYKKCVRDLVGSSQDPNTPYTLNRKIKLPCVKKSLNFTSKVIAIVFWTGLCDAITRDFSKNVIAKVFRMEFAPICRDLP